MMRVAAIALSGALALFTGALPANAAPVLPDPVRQHQTNLVRAGWYCGLGYHLNRWGRCVRNRYADYGPQAYSSGPYYRRHAPNDSAANLLNRQQLARHW